MKTSASIVAIILVAFPLTGCVGAEPMAEEEMSYQEPEEQAEPELQEQATDQRGLTDDAVAVASPAASAAAYNGVCGSGYGVIDSHALTGGTVYLTYNSSTRKNCVVTIQSTPGTRRSMKAKVSLAYAPWIQDSGSYTTYAGPVYVYAPNDCIDWGGEIEASPYYEYNSHCG